MASNSFIRKAFGLACSRNHGVVWGRALCTKVKDNLNKPATANTMPRPGGIASFMRLPVVQNCEGLDACFVGIPLDIGTSNRSGTRHGARQIRQESVLLGVANIMTGAVPYSSLNVADIGDVPINLYSLKKSCKIITDFYLNKIPKSTIPLTMGGDHTITYPILKALKEKHGPLALVHVDAHLDTNEHMFGMKIAHGTPFRRCVEDGLLISHKVHQIGIRAPGYSIEDLKWPKEQGFKVYLADKLWYKSLAPLMEDIKKDLDGVPVYLSFDIDALDPSVAPGTGTLASGGLTIPQALEVVRGCRGLNVIGCDLVEVSPPYDLSGTTAKVAADILFEMLCILPGAAYE